MATSMGAETELLIKEKREEKGVKAETAVDDATHRFDYRASTPATPPPGQGSGAPRRGRRGATMGRVEKVQS